MFNVFIFSYLLCHYKETLKQQRHNYDETNVYCDCLKNHDRFWQWQMSSRNILTFRMVMATK